MKPTSSPVFAFPQARMGSFLPNPLELLAPSPARAHTMSSSTEHTSTGRGSGRKPHAQQSHTFTLRAPHIWEDEWTYELDHHGDDLHIPTPVNEPGEKTPGRNVVVFQEAKPPKALPGTGRPLSESPLKRILADINARAITPRQMQALSLDLYVGGVISWDEHAELSFQAELHPDFERTIGALTGERSLPDQPRDYVKVWEQRLDFERRFAPAASRAKERALHILSVLRRIDQPATLTP